MYLVRDLLLCDHAILKGHFLQDLDLSSIFGALFEQLEIGSRDQLAFGALLRHREVLGDEGFGRYCKKMDTRQRNIFRILSQTFDDKDFHLHVAKKRLDKDGVSFGMIPNSIINKLLDRYNRTIRAEGAVMLTRQLENSAEDERWDLLVPYIGSFIKFLGHLLTDASPKVINQKYLATTIDRKKIIKN